MSHSVARRQVRQNAVRALGSFGRLFDANETSKRPSSPLPQSIIKVGKSIEKTPHILEDVVNSLSKNVLHGSVKVNGAIYRGAPLILLGNPSQVFHRKMTEKEF